jgi:anthranilate phosphoribosyltransferase
MAERMLAVLHAHGAEHVLLVHGHDGLDELSTTGPSTVFELHDGAVTTTVVDPTDLGVARARPEDLRGGDPTTNAELARRVLAGEPGAHRDIVVLNAAAALMVGGVTDSLAAGLALAADALDSGEAMAALERLRASSLAAIAVDGPG